MNPQQRIIVGCMRLCEKNQTEAFRFLDHAMEAGCSFFDHADIYGQGECERIFGKWLSEIPSRRQEIFLQTKCGIVPGKMYDCSKEYILKAVDRSLERLQTDHLDRLLLHRPDALLEPEEVAEAFDQLERSGKVLEFGVSNFNAMQISLLQSAVKQKIICNQLQFSAAHTVLVTSGMENNMKTPGAVNRDGYTLDYCRLHQIQVQAWSPLQYGMIEGIFLTNPDFAQLNQTIANIADQYGATPAVIAIAWILRHPANIQVVCGTMNLKHLDEMVSAQNIRLTREEWYKIYLAGGNILP
ncbi:aldo/keto reductase [Anaerotignum lactatifermentans]|uniref:Aldo/keto reductase n=1 Tax=Anaerotignum lactatifermentans TaxID=160404 RepID=A0ABS2GAY7_9FIRM|nr:aldo/keto reductase [Anaerotignum lactatifermentans]MBM6828389.1 aldo/keto reductase [Anaerotignum lactatifermentans]MBM6877669.1 aldo/keto reductase [Anaerotignum lactatifermentans]MBM6949972.1 aldo/keto reductase [Anaerotignum lactatifermentans]